MEAQTVMEVTGSGSTVGLPAYTGDMGREAL